MSKWRAMLEKKHGRGVAHKTIRVWRTFWKIMLGMKVARTADPTLGIRNRAPAPRWQRWSEGEAVRLVKVLGVEDTEASLASSPCLGTRNSVPLTFVRSRSAIAQLWTVA